MFITNNMVDTNMEIGHLLRSFNRALRRLKENLPCKTNKSLPCRKQLANNPAENGEILLIILF